MVPLFANTLVSTSWAMGGLCKILTSQKERIEDRRALRAKGLLQPQKPFLQRLRASPNLWVYTGFAAIALTLLWGLITNA